MSPLPINAIGLARSFSLTDVVDLARQVALPHAEQELLETNGLRQVPVAQRTARELIDECMADAETNGWEPGRCRRVIVAHSLEASEESLQDIHSTVRTHIPDAAALLIVTGQPCSIFHLGLKIAATAPLDDGTTMVLGVDLAPEHKDRFFFGSAMGDAVVAMAVGDDVRFGSIEATAINTHVLASDGASSPPDEIARFRQANPSAIRAVISEALTGAGHSWSDLDAIVPHTPNRLLWDAVSTLCLFPRDKVFDDGIAVTGHMNSNDVIVHFSRALDSQRLRPGDLCAIVSAGFGGTRSCTIVRC